MKLTFLGTGTSHGVPMIGCECAVCRSTDPRDRRTRTSVYLESDTGAGLLIDTSPELRLQALAQGVVRVDAILFTHSHADHMAGLDDVRRFNAVSRSPMPIFADTLTLAELRLRFGYVFDTKPTSAGGLPELRLWAIGGPFCVAGQEIIPVPIWHGARLILGFRIGGLAYLTDCSGIPEASWPLLEGLDVLVLDALRHRPHPTHFALDQSIEAARQIGARQTYFTHMAHDLGHEATCAALPAGITLAYDGLRVDVG